MKFSWVGPTANTDSTPIVAGELTGYRVGVRNTTAPGSTPGVYTYFATVTDPTATGVDTSALAPSPPAGVLLAAAVQALTADTNSDWTPEVTFTLTETPNAPTGFSVA